MDLAIKMRFFENSQFSEAKVVYKYLVRIFKLHNFTLREAELGLKLYLLILRSTPNDRETFREVIPLLVLLKIRNISLYRKLLLLSCRLDDVLEFIFPTPIAEYSERIWSEVVLSGAACLLFRHKDERVQMFLDAVKSGNQKKPEVISRILAVETSHQKFLRLMEAFDFQGSVDDLRALASKMDLIRI